MSRSIPYPMCRSLRDRLVWGAVFASALAASMLLVCPAASGAPVSGAQARTLVARWLRHQGRPLGTGLAQQVGRVDSYTNANDVPVYHVVCLDPEGFVIVAGDDRVEPIVAFAAKGKFDPSADTPLGALVASDLPERLARAAAAGPAAGQKWDRLTADGEMAASTGSVSDERVSPLVESRWSQSSAGGDYCYNLYTPNHYVCGCVATAMAQAMRYWQHPSGAVGTPSFTVYVDGEAESRSLRGGDGSGGAYPWDTMPLVPSYGMTEDERQAVGALCHDAGVAANMMYAAGGSGAYLSNATNALRQTFDYANAIYGWNSSGGASSDLNDMLNANLDAGRPVLLGIFGDGGHAIVCDGYGYNESTLYHHLNMGWAGSADAWYNLPNVDTGYYLFDSVSQVIYNIYRTGSGEIISGRVTDTAGLPIEGVTVTATAGASYAATTNTRGIYAIDKVPANTSFSVAAAKAGYTFTTRQAVTGLSQNYSGDPGNVWGVDFVGASGQDARTLTVESSPIADVAIAGTPAGTTNYAAIVEDGTSIALTAPDVVESSGSYYTFVRWQVDGSDQPLGEATVAVVVSADTTVVALYEQAPELAVATVALPAGQVGGGYAAPLEATGGVPGYTWSALPCEQLAAQQAPSGGTARGWRADDGVWRYDLPFPFPFGGASYSSVYVCSNGFLDLEESSIDYSNSEAELAASTRIAPLWDDLKTNGSAQSGEDIYIHQPDAHAVAIRWVAETYWGSEPVSVEVVLRDTGEIEFHYGSGNGELSPTVGISAGEGRYVLSSHDGVGGLGGAQTARFRPLHAGLSLDGATGQIAGSPQEADARAFRFYVEDSVAAVAAQDLSLTVEAEAPCLAVISGDDVDFGMGGMDNLYTEPDAYTVRNTGGGTLDVTVTVAEPFYVLPSGGSPLGTYAFTLAADESCTFGAAWEPDSLGGQSETLTIASSGGSASYELSGFAFGPLVVWADATPDEGEAPLTVEFEAEDSCPLLDPDYEWDFGDGATGTGDGPSHTYTEAGTYTVTVVGTDDIDRVGTDSLTITVTAPVLTRTLAVRSAPFAGVAIAGDKPGVTDYTASCDADESVTLTAPAEAGDGYAFERWEDGAGSTLAATPSLSITVSADATVVAVYDAPLAVVATAEPTEGPAPLTVAFDAQAAGGVPDSSGPPAIDFASATIEPLGSFAADGANAAVTVEDAGATLHLAGNSWRRVLAPYTITADTVLTFDFKSTARGEVQGIGFDSGGVPIDSRTFKLYGTQPWGNLTYNDYEGSAPDWKSYTIPVGQHFTGAVSYLIFTNDHDVADADAQSYFRNVRVYEDGDAGSYTYAWDFGDGGASALQSPEHDYAEPGTYTATVTATDSLGEEATDSVTVTVTIPSDPPVLAVVDGGDVDFGMGGMDNLYTEPGEYTVANSGGEMLDVTVTVDEPFYVLPSGGSPVGSYVFSLGAGESCTFGAAWEPDSLGGQSETLTISSNGGSASYELSGFAFGPLVVWADATPEQGEAPLTVEFEAEDSCPLLDPDYEWDFGDGATGTGDSPSHTYTEAGTYTVTVVGTDDIDRVGTDSLTITVTAPVVEWTLSVDSSPAGVAVTGDKPGTTPYTATCGDGETVTLTAPGTAGGYAFERWEDGAGSLVTTSAAVTATIGADATLVAVYAAPTLAVTASAAPTTGEAPLTVSFGAEATGGVPGSGEPPAVDFSTADVEECTTYGADAPGSTVTVQDDGATLRLYGNCWRQVRLPYTITTETMLRFDFRSGSQGEVQGIGFDGGGVPTFDRTFRVYGTQAWGVADYCTYGDSAPEWESYEIPVGLYYTGAVTYLILANDHDVASPTSESCFRNVRVYESGDDGGPAYTYAWSFGDGGTSELQNPEHDYAEPGTYTATVTGTDSLGQEATDSVTVTVTAPVVEWTLSVESSPAGVAVTGDKPGTTDYTATCSDGETVTLTAPAEHDERAFECWQDGAGETLATTPSLTVAMTADRTVVAVYETALEVVAAATPTEGTAPLTVQLDAQASGSDAGPSQPPAVDFASATVETLATFAADGANAAVTVEDDGATLHLAGNSWRRVLAPYTITADTVLTFDFKSTARGEVHGIGFDSGGAQTDSRTFKLYGTQPWGVLTYNDYEGSAPDWKSYTIPVGQHFAGAVSYLVFCNDHDVADADAQSYFRNVRVYEDTGADPGPTYSYAWDFGDGSTSALQSPSHEYAEPGSYVATVTATDGSGDQASDSVAITVAPPPPSLDVVSGTDLDFGNVEVGDVREIDEAYTVRNAGGGTLEVTVAVAVPFHIVPPSGVPVEQYTLSLGAGEEQAIGVAFAPLDVGEASQTISFAGAGAVSEYTVSGTGVEALGVAASATPTSGSAPLAVAFAAEVTGGDAGPSQPPAVDFASATVDVLATFAADGANAAVTVEDDGATLHLAGNSWRRVLAPYTITADTVLTFDFKSTARGEVHGIGFDSAGAQTDSRTFKLYGTQPWGVLTYNDYEGSAPDWKSYTIPVGQHFAGAVSYLVFCNDHDVADADAQSYFRNVRVYEDTGDGPTYSYAWDFGDGSTATAQSPAHTYQAAGTYEATVTVTDGAGRTATDSVTVTVASSSDPPVLEVVEGGDVDFGMGGMENVYTEADAYTVRNAGGGTLSVTVSVAAPFYVLPSGGERAGSHAFTLGSGQSHTFGCAWLPDSLGEQSETLTIASNGGTASYTLSGLAFGPLVVWAEATPEEGEAPLTVQFGATDSCPLLDPDYAWDFGDGATGTGASPTHTYTAAGTYTVTVVGTDAIDRVGTDSLTVTVTGASNQPPVIVGASPAGDVSLATGEQQALSVTAYDPEGQPLTYAWTVDGAAAGGTTASFTYTAGAVGQHVVALAVSDGAGGQATQQWDVEVTAASGTVVDFSAAAMHALDSWAADGPGASVTAEDGGTTLHMAGNCWRMAQVPYTVTPNTVLTFDFKSGARGDIHGIGFDSGGALSTTRTFELYGTQNWANRTYENYAASAPAWKTYSIPVGQHFTGSVTYLVVVNDHDVANANAESYFRNVRIQEH